MPRNAIEEADALVQEILARFKTSHGFLSGIARTSELCRALKEHGEQKVRRKKQT